MSLKVIDIALAEVGYLEKKSNSQLDSKTANAGRGNYSKYARDLDQWGVYGFKLQAQAWCDGFTDWCFIKAYGLEKGLQMTFQKKGRASASCTQSVQYYKNNKRFYTHGAEGDQIFFKGKGTKLSHTGLVAYFKDGRVFTVEGNTSGVSGVEANGGGVFLKSYPINDPKIAGYGRPDYSLVEEDEDMDVERFKELFKEMRKELQDNDASKWSKEARDWAIKNGLIQGGSDGSAAWEDLLTREQLVTVLYRFAKMMENK